MRRSGRALPREPWSWSSVAAAVVVVAVPTVYTVFAAEIGEGRQRTRILIAVLWGVAAVCLAYRAARREHQQDDALSELVCSRAVEQRERLRRSIDHALDALLRHDQTGFPPSYDVWVHAAVLRHGDVLLEPWWPDTASSSDEMTFRVDCGITGKAWGVEEPIVAIGADAVGRRSGLTLQQQNLFRDGRTIAAVCIFSDGYPVGVLTAYSQAEDGYFEQEGNLERLRDLSAVVGGLIAGLETTTPGEELLEAAQQVAWRRTQKNLGPSPNNRTDDRQ